jgi:hypothetical protein
MMAGSEGAQILVKGNCRKNLILMSHTFSSPRERRSACTSHFVSDCEENKTTCMEQENGDARCFLERREEGGGRKGGHAFFSRVTPS